MHGIRMEIREMVSAGIIGGIRLHNSQHGVSVGVR